MLFDGSDESPDVAGSRRRRGPRHAASRAPCGCRRSAGTRSRSRPGSRLVRRARPDRRGCYFVHSYAPEPADDAVVAAWCEYGRRFAAAIEAGPGVGDAVPPREEQHERAASCCRTSSRPRPDADGPVPGDRPARRPRRAAATGRLRRARRVYDDDPVAVAREFEAPGARWIHVVDLDAARYGGDATNLRRRSRRSART